MSIESSGWIHAGCDGLNKSGTLTNRRRLRLAIVRPPSADKGWRRARDALAGVAAGGWTLFQT
jgi:hypothetical protein